MEHTEYYAVLVFGLVTIVTSSLTVNPPSIPAKITKFSDDEVIFISGTSRNSLVMECEAVGHPQPDYTWKKDGAPLDFSGNVKPPHHKGTFQIVKPNENNAGIYTCLAKNQWGQDESKPKKLTKAGLWYNKAMTIQTIDVKLGEGLKVTCGGVSSVPTAELEWKTVNRNNDEDKLKIVKSARVTMDNEGSLYFAHVMQTDQEENRKYICQARNSLTGTTQEGTDTILNIQGSEGVKDKSPMRLAPDSDFVNVKGILGEPTRMKCFFAGHPSPEVSWTPPMGHPGDYKLRFHKTELLLGSVRRRHAGHYSCFGTNTEGKSKTVTFNLTVDERPRFIKNGKPADLNGTASEDAVFRCQTEAVPAAHVQWYINNKPLQDSERHSLNDDGSQLTFHHICKKACPPGDMFTVQCNASNIHGYVYASAYLNVLEATQIVEGPTDITLQNSSLMEVDMYCTALWDPTIPHVDIAWFHEKYKLLPNVDARIDINRNQSSSHLHLNLTSAEDNDILNYMGTFTCAADTPYSGDRASAHLSVIGVQRMRNMQGTMATSSHFQLWIVVVIAIGGAAVLGFLAWFVFFTKKNTGPSEIYLVDEEKREYELDLEKVGIDDSAFEEYQRPADRTLVRASRGSMASLGTLGNNDNYATDL